MAWFENSKEVLEARVFVKFQVYSCLWYREGMILLFDVEDCLMFSPSKDKIDDVYASIRSDFNI